MENTALANTRFGLDLFHVVCCDQPGSNGFISPFSMSAALSMTQLGAEGETSAGMIKALCWNVKDEAIIHDENRKYITLLQKPSAEYVLSTANRLYIDQGFSILPEFLEKTQKFYLAEAVSTQFMSNPESERLSINKWVSEQTHNKIQDLLASGSVNVDTKMVLVNAIYFKGLWTLPFDPRSTLPKPFKVSETVTKNVPTMYAEDSYSFWMDDGSEGFSVLEIPYKGGHLSMVILLPTADFGLHEMEKKLSYEKLTSLFSKLQFPQKVTLFLPKFEMTCSYQMKNPLSQLGMSLAFNDQEADFSRMTGKQELYITEVVHKAFIKVNEEGSEATAATAMTCSYQMKNPLCQLGMSLAFNDLESDFSGMTGKRELCVSEVVHKAFVKVNVIIRDKRASNSILFMGHMTCSYQMKNPLCQLGMSLAFNDLKSDFSGITGKRELCISEVIHKAFVKVNEEGSEAAAATAVMMMRGCAMVPVKVRQFIVDHPFFFIIRDKRASNSILFMGHVIDPLL